MLAAISSIEDEISSLAEACWLAPDAICCEEELICLLLSKKFSADVLMEETVSPIFAGPHHFR
jgi:hypothetical protein